MAVPKEESAPLYSWLVLFMLFVVYLFNQWDRSLIVYMWNATSELDDRTNISYATHSSADNYGVLVGPGFTFLFIITGLFVGRAADLFSRKYIILGGLLLWSAAMAGQGFATSFWHLLAARIILGIGQACSAPPSYSLIANYFPEAQRGRANGLFSIAIYFGGALSSFSATLTTELGWRVMSWGLGGMGAAFALLFVFVVREPARAKAATAEQDEEDLKKKPAPPAEVKLTLLETLRETFRHPVVLIILVTTSLRFMGGYILGSFAAKMFSNMYPSRIDTYLRLNALVVLTGGMISANAGGFISDKWARTNPRARGLVPAIGTFIAIPFMAGVCMFPGIEGDAGFYLALASLFFEYVFAECFFGPVFAVLTSTVAPGARAFVTSAFIFSTSAVGSLGPVIISRLDSYYSSYAKNADNKMVPGNPDALRYIVAVAVCGLYLVSALGFLALAAFLPVNKDASDTDLGMQAPLLEAEAEDSA